MLRSFTEYSFLNQGQLLRWFHLPRDLSIWSKLFQIVLSKSHNRTYFGKLKKQE